MLPRCGFEDGVSRSADCVYTAAQEVTETAILSSAVTRRGCNFLSQVKVKAVRCSCSLLVVYRISDLHIKLSTKDSLALFFLSKFHLLISLFLLRLFLPSAKIKLFFHILQSIHPKKL